MNRKPIACLLLSGLVVSCGRSQVPQSRQWNAAITVIDEGGQPVSGAEAEMSWNVNGPDLSLTYDKVGGTTDTNGMFKASHVANGSIDLGFTAVKGGYYKTAKVYHLAPLNDSDPAKWNPAVVLVLKSIGQPTAMYARRVEGGPPAFNQPVGYDLVAGDWVAPHGKGAVRDIIFTGELKEITKDDYDYKLTVSFPNAGDGIQEFTKSEVDKASALRSPHSAPEAGYRPEVVKTMSRHPGQPAKSDMNDQNRDYFFRVRTTLDEKGNVKSALYGKMYGDFMQYTYYLNPAANDHNLEFDPGRNLLRGEKVTLP